MSTNYHVFKAILEGLGLNLTGQELFDFVRNSTDCDKEHFEEVYNEVKEAWYK